MIIRRVKSVQDAIEAAAEDRPVAATSAGEGFAFRMATPSSNSTLVIRLTKPAVGVEEMAVDDAKRPLGDHDTPGLWGE